MLILMLKLILILTHVSIDFSVGGDVAGAVEHNNQLAEDRNEQYQQSTEQLALLGDRDQQCHESTECFQR